LNIAPPQNNQFPAPFNLALAQRPAPYNVPPAQRPVPYTNQPTDFDRGLAALGRIAQLSADGPVTLLQGPNPERHLPMGYYYLVGPDMIADSVGGQACLCARNVTLNSALLVARGTDGQQQPVIAMLVKLNAMPANLALTAMRRVMTARGVHQYTTMVLGGQLSRVGNSMLSDVIALADAARNEQTLACGRIGVTQMSQGVVDTFARSFPHAAVLPVLPGLPEGSFCAVMTTQGLFYAAQDANGPTLFDAEITPPIGVSWTSLVNPYTS
jgi:hypothetical protein